jgi:hypothetical protein
MKVKDIPYLRYTVEEAQSAFERFEAAFKAASNADEVMEAKKIIDEMSIEYETAASLSYNRFSLDTNSEFYQAEMAYYDEVGPLFADIMTKVADMMLTSPYRKELEQRMNPRIFLGYEIAKKSFAPCITEDMQKENAVVTEWTQVDNLYAREPNSKTFKFGYDSKIRLPYVQFPDTIAELIGTGLKISYVRTAGIYGNVSANKLNTISASKL